MNDLIKMLTGAKGTANIRTLQMAALGWLLLQVTEIKKTVDANKCHCAGPHQATEASATATNTFAFNQIENAK